MRDKSNEAMEEEAKVVGRSLPKSTCNVVKRQKQARWRLLRFTAIEGRIKSK
jgi:hypothetical protein